MDRDCTHGHGEPYWNLRAVNVTAGVAQGAAPLTICLDYRRELGGLTRGIRDLANAAGGRVISLDTGPPIEPAAAPPVPRAGLVRLPVSPWAIHSPLGRLPAGTERVLDAAIQQAPLAVIHSLYRAHLPAIVRLCRRHDVPYWIVSHGMLDPWVTARNRLAKSLWMTIHGRRCLAGAAKVLFSTEAERHKARPAYQGDNTMVLPWPVDLPDLSGREAARAKLRRSLGLSDAGHVLLWMGRYDSLKRPVEVVEAFAAAAPREWVLVMAGLPGDLPRERVAEAARRSAPEQIHVRAAAEGDEKTTLLLGADAFISLSWRENFGYALAEAMAFGLPVVIAPDHDLLDTDAAAEVGYSCGDHSAPAATAAIHHLGSASSAERGQAGGRARQWVAANVGRERFRERVVAALARSQKTGAGVFPQPTLVSSRNRLPA